MGLVIMEFGNLVSYKISNPHIFFAYLFVIFEILSNLFNFDF